MIKSLGPYVKRLIKKRGMPVHITFYVTGRCNASCKTCFYWHHINENEPELTFGEIERLAPQFKGALWIAITGGEPFLRDDIGDILRVVHRQTKPPYMTLVTNGFFPERLKQVVTEFFSVKSNTVVTVSVSLDGIYELHDSIRGLPGSFEKACESIRILKNLQSRFNRLRIRVCSCYNAFNQEKIEEIPVYLNRHFQEIPWDFSLVRGNPHDPSSKNSLNIARYFQLKRKYCSGLSRGNRRSMIDRFIIAKNRMLIELQEQIIFNGKSNLPCRAGLLSTVIRENGEVIACEMEEFPMGNLRDFGMNFSQLCNSKQAVKTRQLIKATHCQCAHECNLTTNMVFSIPSLLKCALRML